MFSFCTYRNVVTGAHYHFVSRWTSSTAYIAASLVMMVFVSTRASSMIKNWVGYDFLSPLSPFVNKMCPYNSLGEILT